MCGRYSLAATTEELVEIFAVPAAPLLPLPVPRWNVAPTQYAPTLVLGPEGRRLGALRWGLVPFWAGDPSIGNRLVNARSETAHEKPAFREALRRRRCLVPADGFYEWKPPPSAGGPKKGAGTPYWIHRADRGVMTFAGLWERWRPGGEGAGTQVEPLHTFTILTTDAPGWLRDVHDRVPVIVAPEHRDRWMNPETPLDEARGLLLPPPEDALVAHQVSTRVNRPANDDAACVEPVTDEVLPLRRG